MITDTYQRDAEASAAVAAFLDEPPPLAAIVYGAGGDEADARRDPENRSRWNAVRHGCMSKALVPADLLVEVDRWTVILQERYRPTSGFEIETVAKMGRLAAQLERLEKMKVIDHQRTMDRAALSWHDDRGVYVDALVLRLESDPGVARALARSRQGVDWLLHTWTGLSDMLLISDKWTDDQISLVMNLMGIRPELRDGYRKDIGGAPHEEQVTLADAQRKNLLELRKTSLDALDWSARMTAFAGMPMEEDDETKRLRKQESRVKLDYRRAFETLMQSQAAATAAAAGEPPPPPPTPRPPRKPKPKPDPAPVASVGKDAEEDSDPPARPVITKAGANFLTKRLELQTFEVPATETAPARTMRVQMAFPGGDPVVDSELDPDLEFEDGPDAERDTAARQTASDASRRREKDRRNRRAQVKKARKMARRRRR